MARSSPEERRLRGLLAKIGEVLEEADLSDPMLTLVSAPEPVAVSIAQAATLLNVHVETLAEYVLKGQLRTFRVGRRRLVRLDAVREFALTQEDAENLVADATPRRSRQRPQPSTNGRHTGNK